MAWRCSGTTNSELISNLAKHGIFTSERVAAAMSRVDRANYVRYHGDAYEDSPQTIGYDATISAPHMHAHAAQHLLPYLRPGARVLDVGSGSGYLTAVFHHIISETPVKSDVQRDIINHVQTTIDDPTVNVSSQQPASNLSAADNKGPGKGVVVGIEHVPELVDWSVENLKKDGLGAALNNGNIVMVAGDGRLGYPEQGPYDVIHVGAAAPTMPAALVEQLASPGRMFIPVGTLSQSIIQVDKDANGSVTEKELMGVIYVPLTDRKTQHSGTRFR